MSLVSAAVTGDLRAMMEAEIRDVARGLRRGVERAGKEVQAELRSQARGTGFRDGGRSMANAWRLKTYPAPGRAPRTLRPSALVYTNMPDVVDAFEKGQTIRAKGAGYLAFPTGYNAIRGRRNAGSRGGVRVTAAQMRAARGDAFVIRSKSNPNVRLWCLRVRGATAVNKGRQLKLFVASNTEVMTGRRRGRARLMRETLKRGFVPMFFLMRAVDPGKRVDVSGVRRRAGALLARSIAAELVNTQ